MSRTGYSYTRGGRLQGTYVYLILCKEGQALFAKIGVSGDPIKRLHELLVGCPLEPRILAYVELPSRFKAFCLEFNLHRDLKPWRVHGEWFRFAASDRARFNEISQELMREFVTPSWPMAWTKVNARELLKQTRAASRFAARLAVKRKWNGGKSLRDFQRDSRSS